jgi:2'-5' RNA ligase
MPRLFVAVDVPDAVRELVAPLMNKERGVRFVPREHLHLTLRFIGDYEDVPRLLEALAKIEAPQFTLRAEGVGKFPERGPARVLWAGIQPVQEISALANLVDRTVVDCGAPPDERSYAPHLTIARIKDAERSFAPKFLEKNASLASEEFLVREFKLYESRLASRGAEHLLLGTFPLSER